MAEVEVFQSKYKAEEIEQMFDNMSENNKQILLNKEEIKKLKNGYSDEEIIEVIDKIWTEQTIDN